MNKHFKMKELMNSLTIILFCLIISQAKSQENEIKMIVDVFQSFEKPSNVVANLCWTSLMKKQLVTSLVTADNPKSIKFVNVEHGFDAKDQLIKEQSIFLIDVSCPETAKFLQFANSSRLFGKPYRWFVLGSENETESGVPTDLHELHILPDSEVFVVQYNGNNSFVINLIYKIKPHTNWLIESYGIWKIETGFEISSTVQRMTMTMRRKNLQKETIVTSMVIIDNSTFKDLEVLQYPEIDSITKSGYNQLAALYEFVNATRQLIITDIWGYKINGSWSGIMGHLVEGKAELPGSVMFITRERMEVLDYLTHPTSSSVRFIFREPPLSYQNNLYLLPFKVSVWYCLGAFVIVSIFIVYVNAKWDQRKYKNQNEHDTSTLVPKLSEVTVFVMSAISQQGSFVEMKGTLGRFVMIILFLVFLFMYTAYSASIVVLLQSSSNQIRTLSDLLQSKLELGSEDTPYNRYLLAVEKEPIRKAIYEKKIAPPGTKPKFYELVEGVQHLQKKPFAFNCNLGAAYKVIEKLFFEHEKCGLREISYIQDSSPWQGCRKGSPYLEIFKIGLLRNAEFGLNDRTNQLVFSKKPVCHVRGGSFVSVSLADCYPSLLLLLYGMILGVVLLFVELLYYKRKSR